MEMMNLMEEVVGKFIKWKDEIFLSTIIYAVATSILVVACLFWSQILIRFRVMSMFIESGDFSSNKRCNINFIKGGFILCLGNISFLVNDFLAYVHCRLS